MVIGMHEMYVGETAEIISIVGDTTEIKRLKDMGIREGKLIDLLHYDPVVNRKIVIGGNNTRLAFDVSLSKHIRVRPLKGYFEVIKSQAYYDNLTGCLNRHATNCILASEYEKFVKDRIPLSLLLADIDHFKRINDACGHTVGDSVLKNVSALLKQALRRSDILCRWGGEEFLILLRGTVLHEARQIAERLRQKVASHIFPPFEGSGIVTVSIGGCGLPPDRHIEHLVDVADTALYRAKNNGRNLVNIC